MPEFKRLKRSSTVSLRISISCGNSSRFVFHYLQSHTVQEAIAATTFGSTQSLLNLTDLRELLVAVPPLQEQQTIANIIDTMDEAIAHTSSLIAKLKQMKAGLLHDLLTRGLDENGELRDAIAHPEQFKDSPLGQIPKDWEAGKIGSHGEIQNHLRKPISAEERDLIRGHYPYYGPTGILDYINEYRFDGEYVLIGEDGDHFLKFKTQPMTLLVSGEFNDYSRLSITNQPPKTNSTSSIGVIGEIMAAIFGQALIAPEVLVRVIQKWPDFIFYPRDGRYAFLEAKAFTQKIKITSENQFGIPATEFGECLIDAVHHQNFDDAGIDTAMKIDRELLEKSIETQVHYLVIPESSEGDELQLRLPKPSENDGSIFIRKLGLDSLYKLELSLDERIEIAKQWEPKLKQANEPWKSTDSNKKFWRCGSVAFSLVSDSNK